MQVRKDVTLSDGSGSREARQAPTYSYIIWTVKQVLAEVLENEEIMQGGYIMRLLAPEIAETAKPGQFLMISCGDELEFFLRHPLSLHRLERERGVSLYYRIRSPWSSNLSHLEPGDKLDILGPLGNGFSFTRDARHLLLLAQDWGIGPIIGAAEQGLERGCAITLVIGAPTASQVYPLNLLLPELEVVVSTEDGSMGHREPMAQVAEGLWSWADAVFAAGSVSLYHSLEEVNAHQFPRRRVQVMMEAPMACGVGACFACSIETKRGMKLACREGPVFRLEDLIQ